MWKKRSCGSAGRRAWFLAGRAFFPVSGSKFAALATCAMNVVAIVDIIVDL
jgi:hypothetical protein